MENDAIQAARINTKGNIIVGIFVFVPAIIVAVATVKSGEAKTSSPPPMNIGRDNINAGHDVTVNNTVTIGDTAKPKTPPPATITVISNNQKGGITAANVVEIKHVTVVRTFAPLKKATPSSAPYYVWDSVKKVIHVRPLEGIWEKPFLGFPKGEKDDINPRVEIQDEPTITLKTAEYSIGNCALYGLQCNAAATSTQYYSLHYDTRPSYVIFGNYPAGPLFKLSLPK